MHTLEQLQRDMTSAILTGESGMLASHLVADRTDATSRFGIYRNNTFLSLTEALIATFPATVRLLDARFFRFAAAEFIRRHPPRAPRLAAYGAGFPAFLARHPACRGVAYVADVARLEWAVAQALHAPEGKPLASSILSRSGRAEIGLRLQPSLVFHASRWPVLALWRAQQPDRDGAFELSRRAARLSVHRAGETVRFIEYGPAEFAFRRALARGSSLEGAVRRALSRVPRFDLVAALVRLFGDDLVIGTDRDGVAVKRWSQR